MNEEELYAADQEDRYFNRLRRYAGKSDACSDDDSERGGEAKDPFSPDYFNYIREGR